MRTISCYIGLFMSLALACAQPFTYQGFLRVSGNPASGTYDFRFRLYDAPTGGAQVGTDQFANDLTVQNGLFTTAIDFGAVWTGADRYLEIAVRPGSSTGGYQELAPRVRISPTPYAIRAATAGTANPIGAAGGDLSGSYPNPTVARLQGRAVSSAAPSSGQVLKWNGSAWAPANDDIGTSLWQASGSDIFYNAGNVGIGTSSPSYRLHVETNAADRAIYGFHTATTGTNYGVYGLSLSTSGTGVYGRATTATGTTYGVYGLSLSTSGRGVYGEAAATDGFTYGVYGRSFSTLGRGVYGWASATSGATYGVYGQSDSASGRGVYGVANATSGITYGVWGKSHSTDGRGVFGWAGATSGATYGVFGQSDSASGRGVLGLASATSGENYGVIGSSAGDSGRGVYGVATATSGTTYGVLGQSASPDGTGVYGVATATSGVTRGVWGLSNSDFGIGVFGRATANGGAAVGVWGDTTSSQGVGVYGAATASSGSGAGVVGNTRGTASNAYGVVGYEPSGGAGHAVYAGGTFAATGTKSFQIDHPLRPETHFLNHFCTEAPEPLNAYSGNITTDAQGYAVVQLPDYFEAINRDFRYQLTVIGGAGEEFVQARVVRKIQNNQFVIRTSAPFVEVSWEVKAVRNDLWVQRYGYQTEQEKEGEIKGKYLHPELYGQPKERGIFHRPEHEPAPNESGKP